MTRLALAALGCLMTLPAMGQPVESRSLTTTDCLGLIRPLGAPPGNDQGNAIALGLMAGAMLELAPRLKDRPALREATDRAYAATQALRVALLNYIAATEDLQHQLRICARG